MSTFFINESHEIFLPFDLKESSESNLVHSGELTCLETFLNRIEEQTDFQPCLDQEFLMRFLRHSKFDSEKAFTRLQKFYSVQKNYPEFFEECAESALSKAHLNKIYISPYRMRDNSVLYIHKFFDVDLSELPAREKFYLDMIITDEHLENPFNQESGSTFIMDCSGLTASKILHYTPSLIKAHFEVLQGSFPYRVKAIHAVNLPAVFQLFYNIAYPLMPKKLQERLFIHSDNIYWQSLHSLVPASIIPKEYGGDLDESSLINAMDNIYEKEKKFRKTSPKNTQINLNIIE